MELAGGGGLWVGEGREGLWGNRQGLAPIGSKEGCWCHLVAIPPQFRRDERLLGKGGPAWVGWEPGVLAVATLQLPRPPPDHP